MAAIDFPNSPALNQEFTAGSSIYKWNGTVWEIKSSATPPSSSIVSYSAAAPENPVSGQVWVESDVNVNTIDTTTLYTKTEVDNALALKANLSSPTLTGTPEAPTAAAGTNTTQIATTAFVNTSITNLINGAPGALDTLDELAAALGDDANFATTVTNSIASKAPLESAALTGTPTAPTAAADTNTTQIATTAFVLGQAGSSNPLMDGTASPGSSSRYARQDHVHATDTTRAALASPTFTGTPAGPTAAADTNTTQLATTAYVIGQASSITPSALGSASTGTSLRYARADHIHAMPTAANVGAVPSTLVDAKGDLIVATADNTVARLPVGTNNQVLIADSAQTAGVRWGTVSSGAMVYVGGTSFTSTTIVNVNNVFSSNYENYKVILTGTGWSGGAHTPNIQLRYASSNETANAYTMGYIINGMSNVDATTAAVTSNSWLSGTGAGSAGTQYIFEFDIFGPNSTVLRTFISGSWTWISNNNSRRMGVFQGYFDGTNQFVGFSIYGTDWPNTGNVRVYGYVNS